MTLTIELSPETEQKLQEAARLRGVTPEEHVLQIVDQNLNAMAQQRAEALRELFDSYTEEDDDGDVCWDEIFRRMDESRPEGRKLFPAELKGITW